MSGNYIKAIKLSARKNGQPLGLRARSRERVGDVALRAQQVSSTIRGVFLSITSEVRVNQSDTLLGT